MSTHESLVIDEFETNSSFASTPSFCRTVESMSPIDNEFFEQEGDFNFFQDLSTIPKNHSQTSCDSPVSATVLSDHDGSIVETFEEAVPSPMPQRRKRLNAVAVNRVDAIRPVDTTPLSQRVLSRFGALFGYNTSNDKSSERYHSTLYTQDSDVIETDKTEEEEGELLTYPYSTKCADSYHTTRATEQSTSVISTILVSLIAFSWYCVFIYSLFLPMLRQFGSHASMLPDSLAMFRAVYTTKSQHMSQTLNNLNLDSFYASSSTKPVESSVATPPNVAYSSSSNARQKVSYSDLALTPTSSTLRLNAVTQINATTVGLSIKRAVQIFILPLRLLHQSLHAGLQLAIRLVQAAVAKVRGYTHPDAVKNIYIHVRSYRE